MKPEPEGFPAFQPPRFAGTKRRSAGRAFTRFGQTEGGFPGPSAGRYIYYRRDLREGFGLEWTRLCRDMAGRMTDDRDAPRYFVRFADAASGRRFVSLLRQQLAAGRKSGLADALESFGGARVVRFRLKETPVVDPVCGLAVEEDRKLSIAATKVYLPFSGGASLAFDPGKKIPWGVADIGAPKLWKQSRGRLVKIGVIDTGADYRHPDIRHCLRRGINLLDHRFSAEDDNGHGTHIAGTIAAGAARNGRGIRGVAPGAEIYPVKAFDREGSAYVSDIVLAIDWCLANGMHIINMSFGMPDYSQSLHDAVREAWDNKVTVVASAGNSGKPAEVDFPARCSFAIAVGALNRRGRIAPFSNRGREVDVYAPGEAIYSAWLKGRYNELNGTSMAAAHVSGTVALILARRREMSPDAVRRVIARSSSPLAGTDAAPDSAGRLNAVRAFDMAMRRARAAGRRQDRRPAERFGMAAGEEQDTRRLSRMRKFLKTAAAGRRPAGAAARRAKRAPGRRDAAGVRRTSARVRRLRAPAGPKISPGSLPPARRRPEGAGRRAAPPAGRRPRPHRNIKTARHR